MNIESLKNCFTKHKSVLGLFAFIGAMMLLNQANAGADSQEFTQVYQKLTDWAQGTLGKILALTCIIVGTAFTISRGTLIYAVIGIAMCLVLYNAPSVIDGILTATVTNVDSSTLEAATQLNNGLQ